MSIFKDERSDYVRACSVAAYSGLLADSKVVRPAEARILRHAARTAQLIAERNAPDLLASDPRQRGLLPASAGSGGLHA